MRDKVVACVILNYNDSDNTIALAKRIENYNNINNVIIVDNNSSDNSFEKLELLSNNKISVIKSNFNGGYGYGNNWGIKYAQKVFNATHVIVANPDVVFSEKTVSKCLEAFDKNEKIALTTSIQRDVNDKVIELIAWNLPTKKNLIFSNEYFFRHTIFKREGIEYSDKEDMFVDCIPGSFLVIDTEKFNEINYYNEKIFLYNEENWLGYKLREKGYLSLLITNDSYMHKHSISINKSIPSISRQRMHLYNSTFIILEDIFNINNIEKALIKIFFRFCYFEEIIINFIKARG